MPVLYVPHQSNISKGYLSYTSLIFQNLWIYIVLFIVFFFFFVNNITLTRPVTIMIRGRDSTTAQIGFTFDSHHNIKYIDDSVLLLLVVVTSKHAYSRDFRCVKQRLS